MNLTDWLAADKLAWAGACIAIASQLFCLWSARALRRRTPALSEPVEASALLIIAASGTLPNLLPLHAALQAQRCAPQRILFVVESVHDPAYARLQALIDSSPLAISVLVAGEAERCSQKSHNLAVALQSLQHDHTPYVVLADADILPSPDWLGHLLRPLQNNAADLVTGYRWPVPTDHHPASLAGSWIDRAIASMPKLKRYWLAWGGSLAMRRELIAQLDLPGRLREELSDDLAIATYARQHGLKLLFRSAVLVHTPFHHDVFSLMGFMRRQYQMLRLYRPQLWLAALLTTALNLLTTLCIFWLATRSGMGLLALLLFLLLGLLVNRARIVWARKAGIADAVQKPQTVALFTLAPLLLPLLHSLHLLAILGSLQVRQVHWAHCRYRMHAGRVTGIQRRPWTRASTPAEFDEVSAGDINTSNISQNERDR
ncbi:glycosyltransferase [Methylobacillus flagellatus]|uniref:glycosyltransferase n=1 Tax=Methylobacillus flagellatus TaxID=405 RepID=UPI0010F4E82E|nr:glycosyltransferase [Methylobacillus flagellatus]